jgi:hypothetical protein
MYLTILAARASSTSQGLAPEGVQRRSRASGLRPLACDLNLAGARTPCSTGSGPRALGPAQAGCRGSLALG